MKTDRKAITALLLIVALLVGGCADLDAALKRVKDEVLSPFQSALKASLVVYFTDQLETLTPQLKQWFADEFARLFDEKARDLLKGFGLAPKGVPVKGD